MILANGNLKYISIVKKQTICSTKEVAQLKKKKNVYCFSNIILLSDQEKEIHFLDSS